MTQQATTDAVRRAITVQASAERAFEVFTGRFDTWWPRSHHIGAADMKEAVIEPREGGRFYERGVDGSECDWGRVLAWEPPSRLLLTWQIDAEWQYDPDPEHASEVEVRFTPEGDGTRVELEHRHFERHGADGAKIRDAVGQEGGWGGLLGMYAEAVAKG